MLFIEVDEKMLHYTKFIKYKKNDIQVNDIIKYTKNYHIEQKLYRVTVASQRVTPNNESLISNSYITSPKNN